MWYNVVTYEIVSIIELLCKNCILDNKDFIAVICNWTLCPMTTHSNTPIALCESDSQSAMGVKSGYVPG